MRVLVDADTIYYKAAFKMNKLEIRKSIKSVMLDIEAQCFADEVKVAVKGHGNFRKDLYAGYKSNRVTKDDIREYLNYGHQHMVDKYDAVMAHGMEADDLVSIWAYEAREEEIPYVIAGIDKDLKQIPGNHYNFNKQIHEFVDDDNANLNLMLQCLTGDTSDHIPGIKGVGPVKASKILANVPMARRWSRVRAAWRGHGAGSPELSYRLLRMLTSWDELEQVRKECEQKKTEDSTPGKSNSGSIVNLSPSMQPTSGSEGET